MRLGSTRIITRDVSSLTQFYQEITGIVPWIGSPEYVEFRTSGGILAIGSENSMNRYGAGGAIAAANRSAIIEFQVEDVDQERERLDSAARNQVLKPIEYVLEPTNQPWGNRSMLFRDPDGNLINFFARLGNLEKTAPANRHS